MQHDWGTAIRRILKGVLLLMVGAVYLCTGLSGHAGDAVTLEVWTHWGEDIPKMRFIEETVESFEAIYPNIRVNIHWINKNRIHQSLQASLPKGQGPDIFYAEPYPMQAQPWVIGGYLLDLKDKLDWTRFEPSAYENLWEYPDGGIYGVPIELAEYAIYYNKALFAQAGIPLPKAGKFTTDEFLEAVKTFRRAGILPVAIGNQDRGVASNLLMQGLLIRFGGVEKMRQLAAQEISWSDPDIVAAFTYMKHLIDAGIFPKEMNRLKYQEGRELFIQGQAAMNVEGTWFFGKIADEKGRLPATLEGHLGAMDYPIIPGGKGNQAIERLTGGSFVIRKTSPHPGEAVMFLDFMTSPENALKWIEYTQSPCGVKVGFAEHVSRPFLQELFRSRGEVNELIVPGTGALLNAEETKVWSRDIGIAFMGGGLSVDEAIRKLNAAAGVHP